MNPHVNTISNRLSLRPPQRDSLEILARVCEIVPLQKDGDAATDFTPNTAKYVFKGIGEFAQYPSLIVTGDNYESGVGIRRGDWLPGFEQDVHINVFNISKINAEVRGERAPRIKRLSEVHWPELLRLSGRAGRSGDAHG